MYGMICIYLFANFNYCLRKPSDATLKRVISVKLRKKLLTQTTEDPTMLRKEFYYLVECDMNCPSQTGIEERSIWNDLQDFM